MVTFKAVVETQKKDGTYRLKIRITHKRMSRNVPTNFYVGKNGLTRSGKIKDQEVLDAAEDIIRKMRERLKCIDDLNMYDVDDLRKIVIDSTCPKEKLITSPTPLPTKFQVQVPEENHKDEFKLNFFSYAEKCMDKMSPGTKNVHHSSISALKRFVKRKTLDINEITYNFLVEFRMFLENEPRMNVHGSEKRKNELGGIKAGCRSIVLYLCCLRHLHNLARDEYNDEDVGIIRIPRKPFRKGLIPSDKPTRHRALTVNQMKKIVEMNLSDRAEFSRDVFILSFLLIGINSVDLFNLESATLSNGILTYYRTKTTTRRKDKAEMQLKIEPEALPYFDKFKGKDGKLFCFSKRYSSKETFVDALNDGLKQLHNIENDIPDDITFYFARHSWATIARNECDISFDTIHEALNHARSGDERVTDIYIKKDYRIRT